MNKEMITKLIKAIAVLLGLLGITFSPESVQGFTDALLLVLTTVFGIAYSFEAWWKRRQPSYPEKE